jgi:hypothetical protein
MTDLETAGYFEQYKGLILLGVTSGIMSSELPLNNALTYANAHFDGVDGCTGKILNSGAAGVPWGGVIDLETMTVIAMENPDAVIDFDFIDVGAAMKDAYEN